MSGIGMHPVDMQTFFVEPDATQMNLLRNQNSGMINSPDAGRQVPNDETQASISRNHASSARTAEYAKAVIAAADADKAQVAQLVQYAQRQLSKNKGNLVDAYA